MIQICNHSEKCQATWQSEFVKLLPEIERRLRLAFCRLGEEARDDAVEEGTVHSLLMYVRLFEKGLADSVSASSLAWFSAKQVRSGRPAAGRMSSREPLSRYAQLRKGIHVKRLHTCSSMNGKWIDMIVEDKRSSVADQVAVRLDTRAWLATLSQRTRHIAKDLACGHSTGAVAKRYRVTPGRISQLRRKLKESWTRFQNEDVSALDR